MVPEVQLDAGEGTVAVDGISHRKQTVRDEGICEIDRIMILVGVFLVDRAVADVHDTGAASGEGLGIGDELRCDRPVLRAKERLGGGYFDAVFCGERTDPDRFKDLGIGFHGGTPPEGFVFDKQSISHMGENNKVSAGK